MTYLCWVRNRYEGNVNPKLQDRRRSRALLCDWPISYGADSHVLELLYYSTPGGSVYKQRHGDSTLPEHPERCTTLPSAEPTGRPSRPGFPALPGSP